MSNAIAFEFKGKIIGVLAPFNEGFVFYASDRAFSALDGAAFDEPFHAHRAAGVLVAKARFEKRARPRRKTATRIAAAA